MSIAWKRINKLLDPGSAELMDEQDPSIHLLLSGRINNSPVYCCAGVPEARKVNLLECFHRKVRWLETILENPKPVIWLHDAPPREPGGRTPIPAQADQLLASNDSGVGRVFCLQARLKGVVPQISALYGDAGAAQTFPVRLADFALLKRGAHMWVGRPDAVKLMVGQDPDSEQLGGAEMHCKVSGVGDLLFDEDAESLDWISRCLSILPPRAGEASARTEAVQPVKTAEEISKLIPEDLNRTFNMRGVLEGLIDAHSWIGVQDLYAKEVITGFARIAGCSIGIIANNSRERGGVLFPESCRKMVRFIKFCDNYQIPLIFLADTPGLMVGCGTEQDGMLREASELLCTLATAKTPRVCVVVRKAYTVGLYAMSGPGFDPTHFWATPDASISVFGPKALSCFAGDRELPPAAAEAVEAMRHQALHPEHYLSKGLLSKIIEWRDLRGNLEKFARGEV